jgi:nitrogen regulatory protein P-II 1
MQTHKIECEHKLVVTILKKGNATKVVQATKKAGAEGATILLGRGSAIPCGYFDFLNVDQCNPKEVILSLVKSDLVDKVLETVTKVGNLEKPGTGVAFVLNTKYVAGICHLLGLKSE